jgi:vacuole morphology and inheritance protein 14
VQNAAAILDNMIKDIVAACDNFDIDSFIPRLARFLAVPHMPNKRRFLIDWTSLLQSVPDIDMLAYLPSLLDGMMNMLSDSHTEIRTAAGRTLDNFLRQVRRATHLARHAAHRGASSVCMQRMHHGDCLTREASPVA